MQFQYRKDPWEDEERQRREPEEEIEEIEKILEKAKKGIMESREFRKKLLREIQGTKAKEKPFFSTMEEWLREIVIDPSFFMLKPRCDRLSHLLEGLETTRVIIPTELYSILKARYERAKIIENVQREEYYPRLLDIIRQWEIPITVDRQGEILSWISSADFWELLSKFFKSEVVPASEYLRGESRFNPIDIQPIKKVLGETVGQIFYEMVAVSEKLKKAVISATYGFVRLCRRVKIPTYESYTEWKGNFREKYKFRGNFFIIIALAAGGALGAVLREYLPTPIPEVASGYITIKIYDG